MREIYRIVQDQPVGKDDFEKERRLRGLERMKKEFTNSWIQPPVAGPYDTEYASRIRDEAVLRFLADYDIVGINRTKTVHGIYVRYGMSYGETRARIRRMITDGYITEFKSPRDHRAYELHAVKKKATPGGTAAISK
jgi:hypothetical protein